MKKTTLLTAIIILITVLMSLFYCKPNGEDNEELNGTVTWKDDFEDGLDSLWKLKDETNDKPLTIETDEKHEGGKSAKAEAKPNTYVGMQVFVNISKTDSQPYMTFWYNVDSIGESTLGVWDLNTKSTPIWSKKADTEAKGWVKATCRLNKYSKNIWIGTSGGNDGDKAYIDLVEFYDVDEVTNRSVGLLVEKTRETE